MKDEKQLVCPYCGEKYLLSETDGRMHCNSCYKEALKIDIKNNKQEKK